MPNITCRQIEINDEVRGRIEKKTEKLRRFFDRIKTVEVTLWQEKFQRVVEVVAHCDGVKVRAQESNEELLAALDRVFDKVQRQIKRYKTRIIDMRRRPARKTMRATETVLTVMSPDLTEEEIPEMDDQTVVTSTGKVIDVEHRDLLEMLPEDAAMHMELTGVPFFIFLNSENHHLNVLYQRPDGHLGLIEPTGE